MGTIVKILNIKLLSYMKNTILTFAIIFLHIPSYAQENSSVSAKAVATARVINLVSVTEDSANKNKELNTTKTISQHNGNKQVIINFE